MLKNLNKFLNVLFVLVIIYILWQKFPAIVQNIKTEGELTPEISFISLAGTEHKLIDGKKKILVFWATWCGPCKIELSRLNQLILEKKIKADQVYAISIGENPITVEQFAKENNYQFVIGVDPRIQMSEPFQVSGTPTILFIDDKGIVQWRTMGLSASLSLRAEKFLN
jgi:cytochrome c biogenesis protein CcmG/thiol:disulfide interchange protein DsbE